MNTIYTLTGTAFFWTGATYFILGWVGRQTGWWLLQTSEPNIPLLLFAAWFGLNMAEQRTQRLAKPPKKRGRNKTLKELLDEGGKA